MRNTDDSGKTLLTTPLSSSALARSCPNGFDHYAVPAAPGLSARPGLRELFRHLWERLGRNRQVERGLPPVPRSSSSLCRVSSRSNDASSSKVPCTKLESLGEAVPDLLPETACARAVFDRVG